MIGGGGHPRRHGLRRRAARPQQAEPARPEPRVGAMLGEGRTDPGHVLMEVTLQDEGGEPFTYIRDGATHWLQAGEGEFAPATAEDLAREGVLLPELDVAAELNKVFALPGRWTYEGTAYEAEEPFEHYRLAISAAALTGTKGAAGKKDVLVADYCFDKFAHPVFMSSSAPAAGVTIEVTYSPLNQNVNIVIPS